MGLIFAIRASANAVYGMGNTRSKERNRSKLTEKEGLETQKPISWL